MPKPELTEVPQDPNAEMEAILDYFEQMLGRRPLPDEVPTLKIEPEPHPNVIPFIRPASGGR